MRQRDPIRALERTHLVVEVFRKLLRGKVQVGASASSFVTSAPPVNPETWKTDKV